MKKFLKTTLRVFEYISLFIVGYYGMKYAFVAGTVFFGEPVGIIFGTVIMLLFEFYILRKEEVIKP